MGEKATFYIGDDWVALLELKPAARTVYGILRCNAAVGRAGVATHTVHVTSSWFTEMTQHWENPLTPPTVRRGLNELIEKGVLIRLNDPQDGSGFVLAFVTDPGPNYNGPVNGFNHAKKVAKRCGTKAYYVRRDETPGIPSVTGVRREKGGWSKPSTPSPQPPAEADEPKPEPNLDLDFEAAGIDADFDPEGTAGEADILAEVAQEEALEPGTEKLAEALERKTSRLNTPGHHLTRDQCRAVARECEAVLALGWDPAALAQRMVSQMGPKIHSPLLFLPKKAAELGAPPAPQNFPRQAQPSDKPTRTDSAALTPEEAASGVAGPTMQKFSEFYRRMEAGKNR